MSRVRYLILLLPLALVGCAQETTPPPKKSTSVGKSPAEIIAAASKRKTPPSPPPVEVEKPAPEVKPTPTPEVKPMPEVKPTPTPTPTPPPARTESPSELAERMTRELKSIAPQVRVSADTYQSPTPYLRVNTHLDKLNDADIARLRAAFANVDFPVSLSTGDMGVLTDAALVHLKGWKQLRSLGMTRAKLTDAGLAHLAELPGLVELYLNECDTLTDAGMTHIGRLTNLRRLGIYGSALTEAAYTPLRPLVHLESLHCGKPGLQYIGDTALEALQGMTKLQLLRIGGKGLTDKGMAFVGKLVGLKQLDIDEPSALDLPKPLVTRAGFAHLANLKNLEEVTIYNSRSIADGSLSAFRELKNLKKLAVLRTSIPAPAAEPLADLHSLRNLHLEGIVNDSLKPIGKLTKLEELNITYTTINDAGLEHLTGMTGLRSLNLYGTQITDAGIKLLPRLPALQYLTLTQTRVTDASIDTLAAMTRLQRVFVGDSKITPAGKDRLKKALPKAFIQ